MFKTLRFGTALSVVALAAISGCATPSFKQGMASRKVDLSKVGLASRAQMALASNDLATAVSFGEQAVEKTPAEPAFRTLLGNIYFASGRFASAEAAYRDSLTLLGNQPQVVLKLALVQIAQGKNAEARAYLESARVMLEPADYGLAIALAGSPAEAVPVLEAAARQPGADARLRQNLALALALSGDWAAARMVASQDVPADQLDQRVRQWMALAKPARSYDQVAAVVGVTPAAADPGQPIQLALNKTEARQAQAVAAAAPQPVAVVVPGPAPAPVEAAEVAPAPASIVTDIAPAPEPVAAADAEPAFIAPPARAARAVAKPRAAVRAAGFVPFKAPLRNAVLSTRNGRSSAVVQLGAYASPQRVALAWSGATRRFGLLKGYAPVSARFDGPRGTVYRLSVKGFGGPREALALCASLRRSGGSCFVRNVAGDAPVQLASR